MRIMQSTKALALAALATQLFAGGFGLQLVDPEANPEARSGHAKLVVVAMGCHMPTKAEVTGTAIGTVDGTRRAIPLKMIALTATGAYAVTQQWPSEGRWVLEFVAGSGAVVASVVVGADGSNVQRTDARYFSHRPTIEEVDSVLNRADVRAAKL